MDLFELNNLYNFISSLTHDEKTFIQSRSYKHPNGFVKIILKKNNDGSYFRLHYWLNELALDQNYHDHGWNFTSKIINGVLKNINYYKSPSTDENALYEYEMDLTKHNRKLNITRSEIKYDMIQESEQIYTKDDVYHLSSDIIHKAHPLIEHTITLMKQEPLSKSKCYLYTLDEINNGHHFENISMKELDEIFDFTIKVIQNHI